MAAQYVWRTQRLGSDLWVDHVGRWWSGGEEIDLVGLQRGQAVLVGECKWTGSPVGTETLIELRRKAAALPLAAEPLWLLFSQSGFDEDLVRLARRERLLLLEPAGLFEPRRLEGR